MKYTTHSNKLLRIAFGLLAFVAFFPGCNGGGGDGGGGNGSGTGSQGELKRSSRTAVRILHGAISGSPIAVKIGGQEVQSAAFSDVTYYTPVASGPVILTIERAHSPGVIITEFGTTLAEKTEYSVLALGDEQSGGTTIQLIAEPAERPAKGMARIQLVNAVGGVTPIIAEGDGVSLGPVDYGQASGYITVPSGVKSLGVRPSWGAEMIRVTVALDSQGEATVLVTGSGGLGLTYAWVYPDLD